MNAVRIRSSAWVLSMAIPLLCLVLSLESYGQAPANLSEDPIEAWKQVIKACQPRPYPDGWLDTRPSAEALKDFHHENSLLTAKAATLARAFYEAFPNHKNADRARKKEIDMLRVSGKLGNSESRRMHLVLKEAKDAADEEAKLNDPDLDDDERFAILLKRVKREAALKRDEGPASYNDALETGLRKLQKEFPGREEILQNLLIVAQSSEPAKAVELAQEIVENAKSQRLILAAKEIRKQMGYIGRPLDLQFTALDGRDVDLAQLKGKVVLVDFWATWCGPCIVELPKVKTTYSKYHSEGFEIIGISFDRSQSKLESFLKNEEMPWPQFFDGQGWDNQLGKRFDIKAIPTIWLVDKKGILRDLNGRDGFERKIEELLNEGEAE